MKLASKIFLLISLFMGVVVFGLEASQHSHYKKQFAFAFHKALHVSMESPSLHVFEEIFTVLSPSGFDVKITNLGAHEYPRLRRYKVNIKGKGFQYRFDETMIEERVDEQEINEYH